MLWGLEYRAEVKATARFFCGVSGLATSQTSLLRDAFTGVAVAVYISDDV